MTSWLAACSHLTSRVARLSSHTLALDLGPCTEREAISLSQGLADRLRWASVTARIGVGPTLPVAQLACLTSAASQRIAIVCSSALPAFLKPLPIALLCALHTPLSISEEIVLRLRRAGVNTLGQMARLDELTLRRQFGAVGALLAALARGAALTSFHPTPPEPALRFRTRFPTALSVDETRRRLPGLASEIAARLRTLNQTTGTLSLTVWWESGGVEQIQQTLSEPTQEASLLIQRLASLLLSLARPQPARSASQCSEIQRLDVRVTHLAPLRPQQRTLWSTPHQLRSERRRRITALADQLAQRYRRPVLLSAYPTHEAATFSEDRYALKSLVAHIDTQLSTASFRPREREQEALIQPHWW